MRDDDDRKFMDEAGPSSWNDGHDPPTGDEDLQRRGRERMLAMWREAVECVTAAAAREPTGRAPDGAEADADVEDAAPPAATWVFPPSKRRAGN
jgi:hypothetical protein